MRIRALSKPLSIILEKLESIGRLDGRIFIMNGFDQITV